MKTKNIVTVLAIVFLVLIIGFILFGGLIQNPSATSDKIKLGYIGPLTGDAAILGIEASQAIQLAVDEINSTGGIDGKQIQLIVEDDQYDAAKSLTAYNKLVNQDGVETIIMSTYGGFLL